VVGALADGEVALPEPCHFEAAETSNQDEVRRQSADRPASLADLYVEDAFGAVHRQHLRT